MPLLVDHGLVDLAGGDVVDLAHRGAGEALVVAEVEVGLGAVLGDEHLAVLERVHRARIDVQVRIELEERDAQAARFEQRADRRRGEALAERREHAARHEDELGRAIAHRKHPSLAQLRCVAPGDGVLDAHPVDRNERLGKRVDGKVARGQHLVRRGRTTHADRARLRNTDSRRARGDRPDTRSPGSRDRSRRRSAAPPRPARRFPRALRARSRSRSIRPAPRIPQGDPSARCRCAASAGVRDDPHRATPRQRPRDALRADRSRSSDSTNTPEQALSGMPGRR